MAFLQITTKLPETVSGYLGKRTKFKKINNLTMNLSRNKGKH